MTKDEIFKHPWLNEYESFKDKSHYKSLKAKKKVLLKQKSNLLNNEINMQISSSIQQSTIQIDNENEISLNEDTTTQQEAQIYWFINCFKSFICKFSIFFSLLCIVVVLLLFLYLFVSKNKNF